MGMGASSVSAYSAIGVDMTDEKTFIDERQKERDQAA
jgi:hypothetical protein